MNVYNGFEESYEWATDPRREQISIRLHPDHLPTHRRPTGQPVVPFVHVDFANSLTWSKSPFDVPVEEALGEIVRQPIPGVDDVELPCFVPTYQFLFTALHLFREAWLVKFSESATDVTLMKFVDVRRLAEHHRDALGGGRLASVAERHGVAAPLAWVLGHLDATFGTRTRADLGLDGRDDAATLAATLDASAYARWRGSMRERLASKDRRRLFEESRE